MLGKSFSVGLLIGVSWCDRVQGYQLRKRVEILYSSCLVALLGIRESRINPK